MTSILGFPTVGCGRRGELLGTIGTSDGAATDGTGPQAPRFSTPRIVAAVSDPFARDADPTVTGDLLELFFMSDRIGVSPMANADIWVSKRATASDPWAAPTVVAELNSTLEDYGPAVSLNGLRIWFTSTRGFTLGKIWRSSRATRSSAWSVPVVVPETDVAGFKDFSPGIDASETWIMFSSDRPGSSAFDLYSARSAGVNAPWGPATRVPGVNGFFDEWDPFVAQGGLVIFFTSTRQGAGDIFWSTRQSTTEPFAPPVALTDINSGAYDSDSTLSPDLTYMLFDSTRTGFSDIYETNSVQ